MTLTEVPVPVHFGANSRMLGPKVERRKCMATVLPCPQGLYPCTGSDYRPQDCPRAKSKQGVAGWEAGEQLMGISTEIVKERKRSF